MPGLHASWALGLLTAESLKLPAAHAGLAGSCNLPCAKPASLQVTCQCCAHASMLHAEPAGPCRHHAAAHLPGEACQQLHQLLPGQVFRCGLHLVHLSEVSGEGVHGRAVGPGGVCVLHDRDVPVAPAAAVGCRGLGVKLLRGAHNDFGLDCLGEGIGRGPGLLRLPQHLNDLSLRSITIMRKRSGDGRLLGRVEGAGAIHLRSPARPGPGC